MRKILLFGIVMLLFVSLVTAFSDPNDPNRECSDDPDELTLDGNSPAWIFFNNSYGNITSGQTFDVDDIAPTSNGEGQIITAYTQDYQIGGGALANQVMVYFKESGGAIGSLQKEGANWQYTSGGSLVNSLIPVTPGEWNGSIIYDFGAYELNISLSSYNGSSWKFDGNAPRNNNTLISFLVNQISGSVKIGGIYIANTTETDGLCPEAAPPPPTGNTINLSAPLPDNLSEFNIPTVNINLTANASYEFNCSAYVNDVVNQTRYEFPVGQDVFVDFNLSFGAEETTNTFLIECWDGLNDTNSSRHTIFIDRVNPVLAVDPVLSSNRSISYRLINITSSVNLTDTNLWGFNITIDGSTAVFSITDLNVTKYNYSLNFNPGDYGLSTGEHTLNFWVSDSHTAEEIPEYYFERNPLTKSITYEFGGGWIEVKPTNKGLFSSFDTRKSKDRYSFEFERDAMGKFLYGTDLEFEISSSHSLKEIDSEFPGHFISPDLGKWIDFDSQYKDAVITTTRIDDKTVRVFIEGIEDDFVVFNSLGGLNIIEKNYTFYYGNFTEVYVDTTLETDPTLFSINFSINDSYVADIDALLNHGGTYYAATTKTTSSDSIYFEREITTSLIVGAANESNSSFYWNYSITNNGAGNDIDNNTTDTANQTVYKMIISNCTDSIAITTAINYTVLDQILNVPAFVTSEGSFTIWNASSSTTRVYGLSWGNSSSFDLCIWPAWANFHTDYTLTYTGYGDTNNRIRTNDLLDNITDYVTLYISTAGEDISINIVDENDEPIEDLDVEAWVYDIAEDNYTLVSEESTDPDGLAVMRLYTAGEDKYRFIIYDGATLLLTSSTFKIYQTSYTFRIVLGTPINSTNILLQNLDYTLSRDITGENFTLRWNDVATSLISKINLTVVQSNTTDYVTLSSQSSTADSGTLTYNVTGGYGLYLAYAYAVSENDGITYLLDSVSLDIREEWEVFGTDALLMSFFFIGTMIFIGLAFPKGGEIALVATIFGMIAFYALGFVKVSLSGVIGIIISAVIILVRLKKER